MRVIVCGSREWSDHELVDGILDVVALQLDDGTDLTIVHGAARGADSLAERWANLRGATIERHPADWNKLGRRAGPIRNAQMLERGADLVVAFRLWGESPGTDHMLSIARAKGVRTLVVNPDGSAEAG